MISLDYSVIYQIVLFVILWLILSKLLFRPYLDLLEERERQTLGAEHDSTDLEHEGARLRIQYEEQIARAQAAGYIDREAILQEARQQRERVLNQAREEAMGMLEKVRREVAMQLQQERQFAAAEVGVIAQEMANKVLGRSVG
jgi:F-type H+-transporting ATPase subunit b